MREILLDELKSIQLNILRDVHQFCIANGIEYSLSFGTLLGAVRHKGYIPWDDDIDIMMPRKSYEKFINSYNSDFYRTISLHNNKNYYLPFAKVYDDRTVVNEFVNSKIEFGVYIDIFPVDNVPDNTWKLKWLLSSKKVLNIIHPLKLIRINWKRSFIKNLILIVSKIVLAPIPLHFIVKGMSNLSMRYSDEKTRYMGILVPGDNKSRWIVPCAYFKEYIDIEFEKLQFKAIKKHDEYLTAIYGDFMQLPPVSQQITHHLYKAHWR